MPDPQPMIRRRTHVAVSTKGVVTYDSTVEIVEPLDVELNHIVLQRDFIMNEQVALNNVLRDIYGVPGGDV